MKYLFLLYFGIHLIISSVAQMTDTAYARSQTNYLEKSKKQKSAAWGLFGIGAAMLVGGTAIAADKYGDRWDGEGGEGLEAAGVVAAMGVAAMVGSIPLFAAAGKNKRKAAAHVSFKMEKTTFARSSQYHSYRYPTLALKIHL